MVVIDTAQAVNIAIFIKEIIEKELIQTLLQKTERFYAPIEKTKNGIYKNETWSNSLCVLFIRFLNSGR